MIEKAGSRFTRAISNMYYDASYVPKITGELSGEPILSKHGVTQGRKSSTSLFSFAVRNIPKSVSLPETFLKGNNVFQLADDSSIVTKSHVDLTIAFDQLVDASELKYMTTNLDKTFYLQLCDNPTRQPVYLLNNKVILSAINDEHLYLRMWFITSNNIIQHIRCNLLHRALHCRIL